MKTKYLKNSSNVHYIGYGGWKIICIGVILIFSGCWDGSSPLSISEVEEVSEIDVVGVRTAPDFQSSGIVSLFVVPWHNGEPVLPAGIRDMEVQTENSSFRVFPIESNERSPKTEAEIAGAVLLDSSGSMAENDSNRLRVDASHLFINRLFQSGIPVTLGVFDFGAGFTPGCFLHTRILQDYTQNIQALREGAELTVASGQTPLFHSVNEVIREDLGLRFRGKQYKRIILLLSDGINNRGGSLDNVIEQTRIHDVEIISVSLGRSADEVALGEMASQSGGSTINVLHADELLRKFDGLAATLTQSHLEARVRINPVPPSGTQLTLIINANTNHRPVTANATFTVP